MNFDPLDKALEQAHVVKPLVHICQVVSGPSNIAGVLKAE